MKFLVTISCLLAVTTAGHLDVAFPYTYARVASHTPVISSPFISYNALPALSHHTLTYETIPHIAYKTEVASSIVGHDTTVAHQDSTVQHGGAIVHDIAPAVEVKTIEAAPVITHKTEIATQDTTIEHDSIIHEVKPAVEIKRVPLVEHDAIITHAAPLIKTEFTAPLYHEAKVSSHGNTVVHPTAYVSLLHHKTPIVGYRAYPVLSHAALSTYKTVTHPIGLAHHDVLGIDKTQYHTQDTVGQAIYGHSEALQQHHAAQDAAGNKVGSFSWIAPDGQVIGGNYIADALGYRISSNAMPIGPAPIPDTAEVVAARAAHFAAHAAVREHSMV